MWVILLRVWEMLTPLIRVNDLKFAGETLDGSFAFIEEFRRGNRILVPSEYDWSELEGY